MRGKARKLSPFLLKGFAMQVHRLVSEMTMFDETEVKVRMVQRDSEGCVIAQKILPITYIKTNHDGKGIRLYVEMLDFNIIPWERV